MALTLLPVLFQAPAFASTQLEFDSRTDGRAGRVTVAIQDGKVRIEQSGAGWMLYDGSKDSAKDRVLVVDPQRRSYIEMTRAEMQRYGKQVGLLRQQLHAQIELLPADQRAKLEAMIGGAALPKPLAVEMTGPRREVGGYPCKAGRLVRGGRTVETFCLSGPDDIKMADADYKTVRRMYQLMSDIQSEGAPGILPDYGQLDGVPVEVQSPNGDFQRLSRISSQRIAESQFTLPAGYTRDSLVDALQRQN
jgi:hypothetical protein